MTKTIKIETQTRDFRTYTPEVVKDSFGNTIKIQLCEELIDGRWEGFYATL